MISLARVHTRTVAVLDLFLAVGLLGVYLKLALLNQQWDAIARFLGKVDAADLGAFDRLGFFFDDIALNLLVVPVAGTWAVSVLFRRYRVAAAFVLSVAASCVYFIELRAQQEVGQYISREVVGDLIGWAAMDPGSGASYLTWPSAVKFACLLGVLAAIAGAARIAARAGQERPTAAARRCRGALIGSGALLLGSSLVLAGVSYAARTTDLLPNQSSVARAVTALMTADHDPGPRHPATFAEVLRASRLRAATPDFDAGHPLVGRAPDADLLIFMMETGPARALDLARIGRSLPGAGRLYDRAILATRHYSTHPYSSDAMFSVLSGLYPQGRRRLVRRAAGSTVNGLMTALHDVPVRRVYVPSLYNLALDEQMYPVFGAELYAADAMTADPFRAEAGRRADAGIHALEQSGSRFDEGLRRRLRHRLRGDFQVLARVKGDITAAVRGGRRYAIVFFPEIGHAPWLPLHGDAPVIERGHALMRLQDGWLHELVETIRTLGRLDRTIIAITADHGLRTRAEDPALPIGRLSDDMFRVPLLIFAPQAVSAAVTIENPTSHVDLAPTVLALLGRTAAAADMQGVPIWQRGVRDRLFFLGSTYGGADGFVEDGTFYMRQALSGAVYRHDRLEFPDETQVPPGSPVVSFVNGALGEAARLQQALVTRILLERHPDDESGHAGAAPEGPSRNPSRRGAKVGD